MEVEEKLKIIARPPTEEIITIEELRKLLEEKKHPVAYDGFEPSGLLHLGSGILRAIKLQDMLDAGCKFILYIADWFAFINEKLGGDIDAIRKVGEYFIEGWKACGVDVEKVKIVWSSELIEKPEYWETFLKIGRLVTLKRTLRCLTILGRTEAELKHVAQLFYPIMQATDIFMLNVDICQLGMDQRKVNMLAREVATKLGRKKPVCVHHHLLIGLQGPTKMGGYDEVKSIDQEISSKMSKSKPKNCIFIHDSEEEVRQKILAAFCPPKQVEGNPILEICKYIIFRKFDRLIIKREEKFGGTIEVLSYKELEEKYKKGEIHPLDLKNAVIEKLNEILEPVRKHFEKEKPKRLLEFAKKAEITR